MSEMKKNGFTLIELLVVMSIIGLIFGVVPVLFDNYLESEKLEKALSKIKYDIQYMQTLRMSETQNYTIAFRQSITQGVVVSGVPDVQFDYVCFNDDNDDGIPDINEVIIDPFNKNKMMYIFNDVTKQYTDVNFDNVNISDISFNYSGGTSRIIRFNRFGGIQVYNGTNFNNEMNQESKIEMSLFTNQSTKKELVIYPLTTDMMIR